MTTRDDLTPIKAKKLFDEAIALEPYLRRLVELKRYQGVSIINGHTHSLRSEFYDLATARKVAPLVVLLEIIEGTPVKWNKDERRVLFNKRPEEN